MSSYIALLRGINVGGKNKIKMAELKVSFENLGFAKVQTYIQSGNVLFQSDDSEEIAREKAEKQIEADLECSVSVILRTVEELGQIIRNLPFTKEEIEQAEATAVGESLYVALLSHSPEQGKIEKLKSKSYPGDKYYINNRDVYLLFGDSVRTSKLAIDVGKLGVAITIRNWNTLNKLFELAEKM